MRFIRQQPVSFAASRYVIRLSLFKQTYQSEQCKSRLVSKRITAAHKAQDISCSNRAQKEDQPQLDPRRVPAELEPFCTAFSLLLDGSSFRDSLCAYTAQYRTQSMGGGDTCLLANIRASTAARKHAEADLPRQVLNPDWEQGQTLVCSGKLSFAQLYSTWNRSGLFASKI
ncbi:uncharacterized protein MEPE_02606 [Melanopsichium pennsylvanicum]|uniref:Uncharacterized protein n=1 Tax=Melanopsichium pennsylvanicum TaxID=63383 RepID=A0AAJ4XKR4_9BASI|nr:uncharacterized protein MEPE_02606 [Melanopsichium pennsylvanicum]